MRRFTIRVARLLLAVAPVAGLAQIVPAQVEPGPWRFVDPGSKAVISVDWKRISHSQLGVMLREKWLDPSAPIPGIEFLDEVDRFIVSSPGADSGDPTQEPPTLVVATGHFELPKIRALLLARGTKPQQFNSYLVYRPQKNARDLAFVLLDSQTILIGDSSSIFASLGHSAFQRAAPDANSILARTTDMDARYDAWAIVSSASALAGNRLTDLLAGAGSDSEARGFEAGVSLRAGLTADITLLFPSEDDAKGMAEEFAKVAHLAAKDKSGEAFLQDFEKRLKFTSEGSRVKITLHLTPQEMEKNAQMFAARRRSPAPAPELPPVAKSTPASTAQPPAAPEKQVIRIEGLDGGTREIPLQHP